MGFSSTPAIPVLKFGDEIGLEHDAITNAWSSKCDNIRRALEEYGCFIVESDKISTDLGAKLVIGLEDLFDLPYETKNRNNYVAQLFPGYTGQQAKIPLYEAMRVPNGTTLRAMQHFTNLMWPDQEKLEFCESAHSLSTILEEMCRLVIRMIFDSYGLSKLSGTFLEQLNHVVRIMKYRIPEANETDVGLVPHVDTNFLTMLTQTQTNGLKIETKGGEWIGLDLSPSAVVFFAGEGLMAWSNGRIRSAFHKVSMAKSVKTRYSFGVFTFVDYIEAPKELVDEEHPLQFKPFKHEDYNRAVYASYGSNKGRYTLKDFCGTN